MRLAIGCECGGGKDAKTSELLKGTDDCLKTTYANGVTCLGHFSSPPDPNDETIMVLRDPVSRLESWAAYSGRSISSMIDWAKRSDSTDGLKVVNSLSTSDGRALKRVSFMCFDRLQEDYSKLRSGHKEGHKWSEYLPTTHQRKNTRNANVEATPEERVEIEHIFSEDLKLWKKHCLDEEDYEEDEDDEQEEQGTSRPWREPTSYFAPSSTKQ